jgi:hypothetical protein
MPLNLKRATTLRVFDHPLAVSVSLPVPTPAPPPAPPAAPAVTLTPALFIVEEYQLLTVPGDIGVTRNVVGTINIPGNAKKTMFVKTKHVVASSGTITQTALESQDQAVSSNLGQSISSSAEQSHSSDQTGFKFDASFHGEVSVIDDSADADVHASGSSKEVRDAYQDSVSRAVSEQVGSTAAFRKQEATSVSESNSTTTEGESIETFEIDNTHSDHAENYLLCQLAVERLSALCLVGAKIGFRDGRTGDTMLRPLSGLKSLVNDVVLPEHREQVIAAITKQLTTVFDYQDKARTFVRKTASNAGELFQVVPDLTTEVKLVRPDGTKKTFTVPGIALAVYDHVLPIPQVGLAKGQSV